MKGSWLAVLSATLFGVSPTLAKAIMGDMPPVLLAGLLYLGSGIGLTPFFPKDSFSQLVGLSNQERWKLGGAILCGGVLAPLFLAYGIRAANAFEVSLLLNFETVATTLIASLIFHEYIGARVWIGKVLLVLGAIAITVQFGDQVRFSSAALLILAACTFWGIDNCLTRDLENLHPAVLAGTKGWAAGLFNTTLAVALGSTFRGGQVAGSLAIGAFSYGLSLVLFVQALRAIGASRTSTYFAAGPFIGMLAAIVFLGETPTLQQWFASILMLAGLGILYRERHEHEHTHETITHRHKHVHDEHHRHEHDGSEGPEPHDHFHTHEPLTHSHPHAPDIHHRHSH